jgi:putative transposase
VVFEEELEGILGRRRYGREGAAQKGYRNGHREREIIGTFGTEKISVLRARIEDEDGKMSEWSSKALPRYQRMTKKAEALIMAVYLPWTKTPRVKRVLYRLFKGAVSKDVVSRAWRKMKTGWEAWVARSLAGEDIVRIRPLSRTGRVRCLTPGWHGGQDEDGSQDHQYLGFGGDSVEEAGDKLFTFIRLPQSQ